MRPSLDTSTVDMTRTRVRLRSDLRFVPQRYDGTTWVHVECQADAKFYRVGCSEYVFLSLLDGHTSLAEALALTARSQGAMALTEERALAIYRWLLDERLGSFVESHVDDSHRTAGPKAEDAAARAGRWNPLWIRIPLGCPDRLLQRLEPLAGWLFSGVTTVLAVLFMTYAATRLWQSADQFQAAAHQVFARDNWIWLLVSWALLKIFHETAHGLVCRRYGGSVRETGIILAFFAPLAYVDVTSSWAFSSRWQRIHTALAGIYIELLVASIAAMVWLSAESTVLSHLLHNIIVTASLSTILFNANPLMRFDGYYVLSDLLRIPNLSSRSSDALKRAVQSSLFGCGRNATVAWDNRNGTLLIYGVLAAVWKVIICVSMAIAASVMFHGAGIVLTMAAVLAWFGVPLMRMLEWMQQLRMTQPMRLVRGVALSTCVLAAAGSILFLLPAPFGARASGIVQLTDGSIVRADVDGFIETLHVMPGQTVAAGDLLLTLRNREIESEAIDLEHQIDQVRLRRKAALNEHDPGAAQVAAALEQALNKRLDEALRQTNGLRVRASVSGTVVLQHADQLSDRFVRTGDELMMIDNGSPRELHISVNQDDYRQAREHVSEDVRIRIGTRPAFSGVLQRMTPRATLTLSHPALAATVGGDLAVVADDTGDARLRLTEHHFDGVAVLPADISRTVAPGERGYVSLRSSSPSVAAHLHRRVSEWIECQMAMAE